MTLRRSCVSVAERCGSDRALNSYGAAWDTLGKTGSLSFGPIEVYADSVQRARSVTVSNYSGHAVTYAIDSSFRFADDEANGAVSIATPPSVTVPGHGTSTFEVDLTIDGGALREWGIGSGPDGADSAGITTFEYDGYINLTPGDGEAIHLAWHVLPRKADAVRGRRTIKTSIIPELGLGYGEGTLHNVGVGAARIESFSLLGRSPDLPPSEQAGQAPITDLRYFGVQTYDGSAVCGPDTFLMRFAINTWEDQSTSQVPNAFIVSIDTDGDGISEYDVYNFDLAFTLGDRSERDMGGRLRERDDECVLSSPSTPSTAATRS